MGWMSLPAVDRKGAGEAVLQAASQLGILLRDLSDGSRPALGEWDVGALAAHVSHTLDAITALAHGAGPSVGGIADVATLSRVLVNGETERDLVSLAARIEASAAALVKAVGAHEYDGEPSWIVQDTQLSPAGLLCHALNELVVHGHDLAKASGKPWPIRRDHALLVVQGFLFPSLGLVGSDLVDKQKVAGRRICFEIRPRGGQPVFFRFDGGRLVVSETAPERVDCRLSVDPAAFLLVAWNRKSQWPAILRGQLLATGRRPWLGLQLRSLLTNP